MPTSSLKKEAAPGRDGETWRQLGRATGGNLQESFLRLKGSVNRAKPVCRRVYIPKADVRPETAPSPGPAGRQIVSVAAVEVLNASNENGLSPLRIFRYGFSRRGAVSIKRWMRCNTGLLNEESELTGVLDSAGHPNLFFSMGPFFSARMAWKFSGARIADSARWGGCARRHPKNG